MALPSGLGRGDVHNDAAARIGRLAEADDEDVARDAEIFDRARQREAVRRDDAAVGLAVDEAVRSEILGIDDRAVDIGEDLELVGNARVIAVGGEAVADAAVAALRLDERFDHALRLGGFANPAVGKNGHACLLSACCALRKRSMEGRAFPWIVTLKLLGDCLARIPDLVIASEAKQSRAVYATLDCFASLAMTE